MLNKKYNTLQPTINNTLKIKNYIVDNKGVMLYIEDTEQLMEIPTKYKKHLDDPFKFQSEIYEKIFNFGKGEEIELINTDNEQLNKELNGLLINICTKISRDYGDYQFDILKKNVKRG